MKKSVLTQKRTLLIGGTYGNSDCRDEIIKRIKRNYICHVIDGDTAEERKKQEFKYKKISDLRLYIISPIEWGVIKAIKDVVDSVNNHPLFTLLLILYEDKGCVWRTEDKNNLKELEDLCTNRCIRGKSFTNIDDLCNFMNKY